MTRPSSADRPNEVASLSAVELRHATARLARRDAVSEAALGQMVDARELRECAWEIGESLPGHARQAASDLSARRSLARERGLRRDTPDVQCVRCSLEAGNGDGARRDLASAMGLVDGVRRGSGGRTPMSLSVQPALW